MSGAAADGVADGAGKAVADGAGQAVADGVGQAVADGVGQAVADGAGQAAADDAGQAVADGAGQAVADGVGQAVADGAGQAVADGAGQAVAVGAGIRVLLADDQMLARAGLRAILDEPDITVVAEAETGSQAIRLAASHLPDVVLMDIRMPGMDGLTATEHIGADPALHAVKVIVLTTYDLDEYVYRALRAGASGFLLKDAGHADIVAGVRVVAAGGALLAPAVTRRLVEEFAARPQRVVGGAGLQTLTAREHEVLLLVAAGLDNYGIGVRLGMSPATAKTHITRIQSKLGVRDRAQLVVFAYETGVVRRGWLS